MTSRSVDPTVFQIGPTLRLIGGRHRVTGRLAFPLPSDPAAFEPIDFPTAGTLWSYTVQRMAPKSPPYRGPVPFEPFAMGYVELPGALIVESRLTGIPFDDLQIGLTVELTAIPLYRDNDRTEVLGFAFTPPTERPS